MIIYENLYLDNNFVLFSIKFYWLKLHCTPASGTVQFRTRVTIVTDAPITLVCETIIELHSWRIISSARTRSQTWEETLSPWQNDRPITRWVISPCLGFLTANLDDDRLRVTRLSKKKYLLTIASLWSVKCLGNRSFSTCAIKTSVV